MKQIFFFVLAINFVSCGTDIEDVDPEAPVTETTKEELETVQEDNITIEQLDGQLDSLINEIE